MIAKIGNQLAFIPADGTAQKGLVPGPGQAAMNEIETFFGPIETTADAMCVFELCRQGRLGRVRRRLHDRERRLIRNGSVFVFDEQESGIRRWTDGRLWSPSRILGNFLVYRELERKPPGGDRPAAARPLKPPLYPGLGAAGCPSAEHLPDAAPGYASVLSLAVTGHHDLALAPTSAAWLAQPIMPTTGAASPDMEGPAGIDPNKVLEFDALVAPGRPSGGPSSGSFSEGSANSLIGPNAARLLKSKKLQAVGSPTKYIFKPGGLIKKTISARVDGRMQHLVCYFDEPSFLLSHAGNRPRAPPTPLLTELRKTRIPADLVLQQNFRKQPTTEAGIPLVDRSRLKRRHSMHLIGFEPEQIPIYPRFDPQLSALDLASEFAHLAASVPPPPPPLPSTILPAPPSLANSELLRGLQLLPDLPLDDVSLPMGGESIEDFIPLYKSSAGGTPEELMEECLRLVIDQVPAQPLALGLCPQSRDPPLSIAGPSDADDGNTPDGSGNSFDPLL